VPIDAALLELLACPSDDHAPLRVQQRDGAEVLVCTSCESSFPITDGIPVLRRDVFGPVPRPGTWGAALLFDGNVGIGGDVPALLARLRDLLAPDGVAVAEVHSEQDRHERTLSRVVDARGRISAPFSWATVGEQPLVAAATGFRLERAWSDGGRRFVRLRRTADAAR